MKTLSMFYRSARTEAENAGIATDGMAESTAKLRQELLALTGGKLDIQINEHEFMSTYDMLKKLSEIWDEIGEASEINQARILEMLGGKRNANVLSSILTNFQDAIAASETAARSSGSAWAENEKYLNSIEGKTKQLQASFETFANQVINSGVVKAFIDIQTAIVNTASWLEKMGLLLPTITALVATIKTIQSISQATKATNVVLGIIGGEGDLATKIKSITDAVSGLGIVAKNLAGKNIATAIGGMTIDGDLAEKVNTIASGMQNAAFKTITFDGVITALKAKITGLGQGLKTLATSSMGKFTIGITAAISLFTLAKNAYDSYINSLIDGANQAYQTHTETVKTIESGKKSLEKMDEEFRDLSSRVGKYGSQGKLTNEEYERYIELVNEIITITPSLKNAYNEKGASLKTGYVDILDEAIQKLDEMSQKDAEFTSNKASSNMQGWEAELNQYSKTVKEAFDHLLWNMTSSLKTESGERVSSLWSDFIREFGGGDLFNNLAEGFSTINLDVAYNAIDKIEKFKEKLLNSGVDKEDIDAWMQGFGPLSQFYDWYKETTTKIVDTYMTSSKAWEATKGLYETIADADKLNELKAGLYEVLRPGMSGDEAYTATLDYLTKFASALNDIQYALGAGSSYDALRAFEELKVKWAGSPTILKMIENAIADMTGAENANANATDKVTQSYANLEKILSKISGFNSFLNKARNGENDPFGMISSAKDVADAYNELVAVTDDIPKIDWTAMTGTVGEDGKITWDTTLIEGYIDAIIDASIANTEFANSNPQAIQWLKDMAKEYGNASKSVTGFSDALSAVQKVADIGGLLEDFSDGDSDRAELLEQLDGILNIWNEFSKEAYPNRKPYTIADMLGANGDDFELMNTMLDKFKREVIADFMQDAGLSSDNWLVKWLLDASLTVDKTKDKIFEVSDAINGFKTAISFKQASLDMDKDDTPAKILEEAVDMLEAYNKAVDAKKVSGDKKTLGDFLTIDENGIRRNIDQMEAYVDAMVEIQTSGIADDTARENAKKALKAYYDGLVAETKEATFEISDAMNGFNEAITFKQAALDMSEDDTPVKILEDAVNMLEAYNKAIDAKKISGEKLSLENFLTIDSNGMRRNLDQMEAYVNAMIEIQTAGIADSTARENAKKALKGYYDGLVQTTEQATFEISDAMSGFNEAISFKQAALDMSEEDTPVKILEDALSMLEAYNKAVKAKKIAGNELKLGDFLTIDAEGMRRNIDQVETYVNAMIEIQTAGIEDGAAREDAKKALKAYYDGLVKTVEEATFEMQDAMSGFSNAMSFKQSALNMSDDDTPAKILEDAVNMLESYNKAVKAKKIDGEELTLDSFLTIDSSGMSRNLDQMEKYVNAMIEIQTAGIADPTARENAKKALKDYYDSLVAETKDAFSQISEAYTFMQEHIVGDRVGDISKVYDDLEKLRDLTGNKDLQLTDFIKWDDDIQDFVYKTDLLSGKVDEFANNIVAAMGLSGEAAEAAAQKIKSSLGQSLTEFDKLNSTISKIKTIQSFANTVKDYKKGDVGILDVLSEASSSAEELGLELSDLFNFETLEPQLDAAYKAADAMVDKWAEGRNVSAELVQQLKEAARAEQEIQTAQQRVNTGYETWSARRSSGGYTGDNAVTYQEYKELIEADARYGQTLEFVNGQLVINKQRYDEVTAAIGRETVATAQLRIEENKRQIDKLVDQYNNLTDKRGDEAKSILQQIQKLSLESQGYAALAAEVDNASSAMQRFLNASDQVNAGAFDAAQSAYDVIYNTLYNKDSAMYGMKNRDQFKQAMDFVIGANVDVDTSGFDAAFEKIKRYLGQESDAAGLQNFIDDLFSFNLVDSEGNLNTSLENIASTLGITKDMAGSLMKQLSQYFDIDWSEDLESDTEQAKSAFETLAEISDTISKLDTEGLNFEVGESTTSALDALQAQMDALLAKVQEINKAFSGKGPSGGEAGGAETETQTTTVEVNTEGAEAATESLNSVAEAKENATGEATVTTVDDGSENMISALDAVAAKISAVSAMTVRPKGDASGASTVVSSLNTIISKINTINGMTVKPKGGSVGGGSSGGGDSGGGSGALGIASAKGGRTLVGELGQEMVVDINSGRFYTVGTNGPEIINLPKDAIVYNHIMTAKLLGKPLQTRVRAQGVSKALGDVTGPAMATYTKGKIGKTIDTGKTEDTKKATAVVEEAVEDLGDVLDEIKDKYEEINEDLEHYIKHLEQSYYVSERAMDYDSMAGLLSAEAQKYQEIIDNCQAGIRELLGNGADDTSEQVQDLEETMWSAYQSMYEAFDKIRDLYKNAITSEIDNIQSAYKNLYDALSEYNESGKITIDTFQSLLENGIQYLVFLKNENGQYDINTQSIKNMLNARKNQLAVETALAYIGRIKEALQNKEYNTVNALISATQSIGSATWDYVFAQAALLKTQGLSNDQYEQLIENLKNLKELTALAADDIEGVGDGKALENIKNKYDALNEQIEHYIEHQERLYKESERGAKYSGMEEATYNKVAYWQQIIKNAEQALAEMRAAGATDLDKEVQEMEKVIWDATDNINEAMDSIRTLFTDALSARLNNIESAFSTMSGAVEEFNENGHITVNTFQSLIDGGIEYLALLKKENGQYVINKDSIKDMIAARKEQLAIESAISYIDRIREALQKGETEKVKQMTDLSEMLSRNSWSVVYAQLASLKTMGLSEEQYQRILENVNALQQIAADVALDDVEPTKEEKLDEILTKYSDLNAEIEHYIKHQEFAYSQAERALDYDGMTTALTKEIEYYKQIMQTAQDGIAEMMAEGADDTDEALQNLEESYWTAYNSMYEALDNIRKLKVEALTAQIDDLQTAFKNLESAADDYNERGGITLNTFQSIASAGIQYLGLLEEQGDKYVYSKERVQEYVTAEKEHLAIETALSYISSVREALQNKETERLKNLIDATNTISNSTWSYVYAQAALLKAQGLSDEMYNTLIQNLEKFHAITASTIDDITKGEEKISKLYSEQKNALDKILDFTEDLIKAEAEDRIDAIKEEIDAYKEIIELKKKSLETSKSENEYQKEVAERVEEIAKIQAKYDLLMLDDSRSAAAERLKLQEEIAEKQKNLADYQQDYSYNAQIDALNEEAEAYEESRQDEIEAIEQSVSSAEKIYQLAIVRIRDHWDTLYKDLIDWNTEQGSVINQEITDNWEKACQAVQKYGSYLEALSALEVATSGTGNIVVADKLPKYHSGGVVGEAGRINDKEVMAVLKKGELVIADDAKEGLYTAVSAVEFLESLGRKIGTAIKNIGTLNPFGAFTPAFAGMATPQTQGYVTQQDVEFNASFNVEVSGVSEGSDAKRVGEQIANSAINNLYNVFNRKGISFTSRLRQG